MLEQQTLSVRRNLFRDAFAAEQRDILLRQETEIPPVFSSSSVHSRNIQSLTPGDGNTLVAAETNKVSLSTSVDSQRSTYFRVNPSASPFYHLSKRLLDITGALIGLILLSPVFLIVFLLVRLDSPGAAFHRRRVLAKQNYSGDTVETFDAFKFRTMIVDADTFLKNNPELLAEYQKEFKLLRDPRITRVGDPLRRFSLDELPQLWNVLTGQMSLVGPRMITPPELANYGSDAARLLSVKPGMTGLWQVSGRTNVPYSERVRLDMYYIQNRSLMLDIEILVRTVGSVLGRRGAV